MITCIVTYCKYYDTVIRKKTILNMDAETKEEIKELKKQLGTSATIDGKNIIFNGDVVELLKRIPKYNNTPVEPTQTIYCDCHDY